MPMLEVPSPLARPPRRARFAGGGLAAILAHQACAGAGVLHPLLADAWPGCQGGQIARRAVQLHAPDHAACAQAAQLKGIVMIFCDGEPLGDIAYTASITGLREQQHLAWCRSRHGVAGSSAERAPRSGRAGRRLAAGMTDGPGGQPEGAASRTGDPRFWALVTVIADAVQEAGDAALAEGAGRPPRRCPALAYRRASPNHWGLVLQGAAKASERGVICVTSGSVFRINNAREKTGLSLSIILGKIPASSVSGLIWSLSDLIWSLAHRPGSAMLAGVGKRQTQPAAPV